MSCTDSTYNFGKRRTNTSAGHETCECRGSVSASCAHTINYPKTTNQPVASYLNGPQQRLRPLHMHHSPTVLRNDMASHEGRPKNYTVECLAAEHLFIARYDINVHHGPPANNHVRLAAPDRGAGFRVVHWQNLDNPGENLTGSLRRPQPRRGIRCFREGCLQRYLLPNEYQSLRVAHDFCDFQITLLLARNEILSKV